MQNVHSQRGVHLFVDGHHCVHNRSAVLVHCSSDYLRHSCHRQRNAKSLLCFAQELVLYHPFSSCQAVRHHGLEKAPLVGQHKNPYEDHRNNQSRNDRGKQFGPQADPARSRSHPFHFVHSHCMRLAIRMIFVLISQNPAKVYRAS